MCKRLKQLLFNKLPWENITVPERQNKDLLLSTGGTKEAHQVMLACAFRHDKYWHLHSHDRRGIEEETPYAEKIIITFIGYRYLFMLHSNKSKKLSLFIILLSCFHILNAQTKGKDCTQFIMIDAIGKGMRLELSPDTVTLSEGEAYYLRILLKSCKGAMYMERYSKSTGNIVFSGSYMDAVKLDTVDAWAVDPATGIRSGPRAATHYEPIRTGLWRYYNSRGLLRKEEEYVNGKMMATGK